MDDLILELIAAIKELAPAVWALMVRQAYIDGVYHAAWAIVGAIMLLRGGKEVFSVLKILNARQHANQKKLNSYHDNPEYEMTEVEFAYTVIGVFAMAVGLPILVLGLYTAVNALTNPEYYAIMSLLDKLK